MNNYDEIAPIIARKILRDELDAAQQMLLDNWLSDPQHRVLYERLLRENPLADYAQTVALTDETAQLERLTARINAQHERPVFRLWRLVAGIAAAVAVVAFTYFLLRHHDALPAPQIVQTPAPQTAEPRSDAPVAKVSNRRVVLTTATGKTYRLGQMSASLLDGAKYDADNQTIAYEPTDEAPLSDPAALNELFVQRGADFCLLLADGTRVWLNAETRLKYPSKFSGEERRVWLQGEAYFEVSHGDKPFIVGTDELDVRVFGTEFNVNTRRQGKVATTLITGSVAVTPLISGTPVELTPGLTAQYDLQEDTLAVIDSDPRLFVGWKTGQYFFERSPLSDLLDEIGRWHDVTIRYEDLRLASERFTGVISRKLPLRTILQMLEETNYISCEISSGVVTVREKL